MKATIAGAVRSKTIWLNAAVAVLAAVELMGTHLTTLFGPKVSAGILLVGAIVNIVLRTLTTQALSAKTDG